MRITASPWSGRSKLATVLGLLTLGAASLVTSPIPVAAESVAVYVGYADIERADPTNFPTPWDGSPNTVFEGCQAPATCLFDSGAVRIVNTSASPLTVDAVTIHIDTCYFTGWAPATLAPGDELIVTQTAPVALSGCTGPSPARMDPSDIGPNSSDYAGICTPNGIQPVVDVTINGTTTSYTDSGQVLNTGGFDAGTCTGNESTQWTLIGNAPCKGIMLTLTPATQTLTVGMTATVTATFTNSCAQPLSNVSVDFAVQNGPNIGRSGSGTTNANGSAIFSYSSTMSGTDTIAASITNPAGPIHSNTVSVTWLPFAPGGGAFVISDLKDVSNTSVYWWGSQWWKKDPTSQGLAPAAFKGFENSDQTPWCGHRNWTTRPGNSSRPPRAVPGNTYMAVIVASHIVKNGPVISGDIVAIVMVHTNPGYEPNPGHPGTGTIAWTLCSVTSSSGAAVNNRSASPRVPGWRRAV